MTSLEKEALERYEQTKADIKRTTGFVKKETPTEKEKRIEKLKADPVAFCKYYFPMYFDPEEGGSEFGWFHKKALKDIKNDKDYYGVWEFPREHAKSVLATIFAPMYLKSIGQVSGMVVCNQSADGAKGLLSSLQAELEANQLYIADYGEQYSHGEWASGKFTTRDGSGFWAIGKGQSPRGIRKQNKRPNLLIIDDFDDDKEVKNEDLVNESLRWLTGALYGSISINQRRIIMVGNRIHLRSCLAQIVGDVGEGDKKNESVSHIKVFALENPKTHAKDESENGVPAWKEKYTRERFVNVIFKQMGYFMTQREYFHNPIQEGNRFKDYMFLFRPVPHDLKNFAIVVTYLDPSYKDGKKNDYKGLVAIGKIWNEVRQVWNWYLLDVWLRRESFVAMVKAHYTMVSTLKERRAKLQNFLEGNGGQADLRVHYVTESSKYKEPMVPTADMRDKPEKKGRIDELMVYFENEFFYVDERLRDSPDYYTWKQQFLSHPNGHDDGPDATEGGIFVSNEKTAAHQPVSSGGQTRTHQTRGVMVNRDRSGYGGR